MTESNPTPRNGAPWVPTRRELIVGVISAISAAPFLLWISPILTFVTNGIVSIIGEFYQGYVDKIYQMAAAGAVEEVSVATFVLLSLLPGLFVIALSLSILTRVIADKWEETGKSKGIQRSGRSAIGRAISISIPLSLILIMIPVSQAYKAVSVSSLFKQTLSSMVPFLTGEQRDSIISEFSLMNSRSDYRKIVDRIRGIAEKNHAQLPKRFISEQ